MKKMTHTERIKAVLEGKPVDRYPIMAWGPHLNLEDRNISDFTQAVIAYQNRYDFDVLKLMQNCFYFVENFGQEFDEPEHSDDPEYMKTTKPAFCSLDDWKNVTKKDIHKGAFGRELENVRILMDYYGDSVPIIPTVFGPERLICQMSGYAPGNEHFYGGKPSFVGDNMMEYIKAHEEEFFHATEVITEQQIELMNAYLDLGVAGFFYTPGGQDKTFCNDEEYEKYVRPFDEKILSAVQDRSWFTILHICGMDVARIERMVTLPGQAVNWEDQSPLNPSLADVRKMTDKVLVGGIDRFKDFSGPNRANIKKVLKAKCEEAISQAAPKLIIAGGCEYPRSSNYRFSVWNEVMDELANWD